jgi:hypothetical protein
MSDEDKQPYEVCTSLWIACTEHVPDRHWQDMSVEMMLHHAQSALQLVGSAPKHMLFTSKAHI